MIQPFDEGRNRGSFKTEGAIETDLPREHLRSPEARILAHPLLSSREFLLLVALLEYSYWSLDHQSVRDVSGNQVKMVSYAMMRKLGAGTELRSRPSGK
jgi:hypothetical protein